MNLPPKLEPAASDLVRQGRWSLVETESGFDLLTEPYSACCSPRPQTRYRLDKDGNVLGSEEVPR